MKKIELNKKTLRVLSAAESKLVAGGWASNGANPDEEAYYAERVSSDSDVSNCSGETPPVTTR